MRRDEAGRKPLLLLGFELPAAAIGLVRDDVTAVAHRITPTFGASKRATMRFPFHIDGTAESRVVFERGLSAHQNGLKWRCRVSVRRARCCFEADSWCTADSRSIWLSSSISSSTWPSLCPP